VAAFFPFFIGEISPTIEIRIKKKAILEVLGIVRSPKQKKISENHLSDF
jgi:hypothetical protein